jgi:hypothetical protein
MTNNHIYFINVFINLPFCKMLLHNGVWILMIDINNDLLSIAYKSFRNWHLVWVIHYKLIKQRKENQKMKTLKIIFLTVLIGSYSTGIKAQDAATSYSNALGVRLGETSVLTFTHIVNDGRAIEALLGFWPNSRSITVLGEKYVPTGLQGLSWYYGVGGHIAFLTTHDSYSYQMESGRYYFVHYGGTIGLGIDGVFGVDYKIPVLPIAISLELKPFVEFNTNNSVYMDLDPGLGLKFAF